MPKRRRLAPELVEFTLQCAPGDLAELRDAGLLGGAAVQVLLRAARPGHVPTTVAAALESVRQLVERLADGDDEAARYLLLCAASANLLAVGPEEHARQLAQVRWALEQSAGDGETA